MAEKKSSKAKPGPFEWPCFLQQFSADLLQDESIYEQVAPIILLVDETLRPLMTPERCEVVLATPRSRESQET